MADIKIYGKLKNATESGKVADYSDIDGAPEIAQATGQSTEKTMSQKAITDAINAGGGGGSGTSSDIPVLDLGDVSSMGSSINLTSDQVSWINTNYNKISAIKFSDTTEAGGTMPLLISTGNYQERTFYYGGVYGTTIYHAYFDMDNYSGTATSGTYYIQKSNTDGAGGGSGSEPIEQETMLSGQYNTWYNGDSSPCTMYLDTSAAGLTHSKIETLEFHFSLGQMGSGTESTTSVFQISLDDIYRLFTQSGGTASLAVLGNKFTFDFSEISLNYDQGTFNYMVNIDITPNWIELSGYDYAQISCGFTYKGFKFANGSTY